MQIHCYRPPLHDAAKGDSILYLRWRIACRCKGTISNVENREIYKISMATCLQRLKVICEIDVTIDSLTTPSGEMVLLCEGLLEQWAVGRAMALENGYWTPASSRKDGISGPKRSPGCNQRY